MAIQWFPGHMHLTRQAIGERARSIDAVVEMLDARLPGSSANPLLAELTQGRPTLKILNKQDLADPVRTESWLAHYNALPETRAIGLDASVAAPARALVDACRALVPQRGGMVKPVRVLICGVPNVGKSTLINTLSGRRAAKTGDEAGITRLEQKIVLADDFYVFDTPGMLWPRIAVPQAGVHLAASGAVGRNAFDEEVVALELLARLRRDYAPALAQRFRIDDVAAFNDAELLAEIGRRRGAVRQGGRIDLQKTAEIVLHEFRGGGLGRVTLETPEEFMAWRAEAEAVDEARAATKALAKSRNKPSRQEPSAG